MTNGYISYNDQTLIVLLQGAEYGDALKRNMLTIPSANCKGVNIGDRLLISGISPARDRSYRQVDDLHFYNTPEGRFVSVYFVDADTPSHRKTVA